MSKNAYHHYKLTRDNGNLLIVLYNKRTFVKQRQYRLVYLYQNNYTLRKHIEYKTWNYIQMK